MIINVDKSFLKDIEKIQDKKIIWKITKILDELIQKESILDFPNIKKMVWFDTYYRLRVWDYRIWFSYSNWVIILLRVRNRQDIYKIFP